MITFGKFCQSNYDDSFIVTDQNLCLLYNIVGSNVFVLPAGEKAKSFSYANKLCSWLLRQGADRNSRLVAVGGGCVGDLAGFAASIFKRGIKLLHVPTTLIAQTDSSIGGKTAINLNGVKNAVGTFHSADILIDFCFLETLPQQQLQNGMGELLKYRMLSNQIDMLWQQPLPKVIEACANFKQQLCLQDAFDTGARRVLNFGHTIGHAMELCCNLPHGFAVANGLWHETQLAFELGLVSQQYLQKWQQQVQQHFSILPLNRQILRNTLQDKKNKDGKVCFVLPNEQTFQPIFLSIQQLQQMLKKDTFDS